MKLKCVIFDFDGTLFDSMYLWDTVAESYVRSRGKEPKPTVREEVRAARTEDVRALAPSVDAIAGGVERVHILDGRIPHSILIELLSDEGIGTMLKKED